MFIFSRRNGIIICRVGGEPFLFQQVLYKFLGKGVYYRKYWHAKHHSRKAEQSAAKEDGHHYPECGETCGVAQNVGTKDISVKLLYRNYQDNKGDSL